MFLGGNSADNEISIAGLFSDYFRSVYQDTPPLIHINQNDPVSEHVNRYHAFTDNSNITL